MLKRDLGTGDLCDNIGLVGVSANWSSVTASPSHHDQAIPILSPLLFMHVGHPYIPLFKNQRNFDLLVYYRNPFFSSSSNTIIEFHDTYYSDHDTVYYSIPFSGPLHPIVTYL